MSIPAPSPFGALALAEQAVDALIDASDGRALSALSVTELLEYAQRTEAIRNRLAVIDHQLVVELETADAAGQRLMRSTAHLLSATLRISRPEAARRVAAAAALARQPLMTGGMQPARYELLAAAQRCGAVSPEHAAVITSALADLDRMIGLGDVTPDHVRSAEATLTQHAEVLSPRDLARCADRLVECLDPEAEPDRTEAHERLRRLTLTQLSGGMWSLRGRLLPETGARLAAILRPLAAPGSAPTTQNNDADAQSRCGQTPDPDPEHTLPVEHDQRDPAERMHDGLASLCGRVLRAGDLPVSGGTPTTVVVTIDYDDLITRTGSGSTSDGTRLPASAVLALADEAEVVPTVLARSGAVLSLGRSRRIATRSQTLALYARDQGCTFPGCDHPPEWCDRHHVVAWADGGPTDVSNLTLLCSYHHHRFERHGWSCRMIDGLPHWTAPPYLDAEQRPRLHERLGRRHFATAS